MLKNFIISFFPKILIKCFTKCDYAFIVHPRTINDLDDYISIFKILPPKVKKFICLHLPAIIFSKIEGLKDEYNKKKIGRIIVCPLIAEQLMGNRQLAKKKIIKAAKLAEYLGANIISLGALTASLTNGGVDVAEEINAGITNGYALTVLTVTSHALHATRVLDMNLSEVVLAVVGAAGSIGSNSAKILSFNNFRKIKLIDVDRKINKLQDLKKELIKINHDNIIEVCDDISKIREADLIITATNLPDTIIRSEHLRPGAVIIDDAQPTDVAKEVYKNRKDVMVLEGGVVNVPNIRCYPPLDLKEKNDVYSCLGEAIILSYLDWTKNYNIGRLDFNKIKLIKETSEKMGIKIGHMQNAYKLYTDSDIELIRKSR